MTLYHLAKLIPDKYRTQILEGNVIYKAIPDASDVQMKMLFIIWSNYIEPTNKDLDEHCNSCLNSMLTKYKTLIPSFIQLEKENKLLDL